MITLYSNLPHLDLHGLDRDYARILINEFIYDNYRQQELKVIIVHGIGTGIIRKTKAFWGARYGASIFQPFYDFIKLIIYYNYRINKYNKSI